MNILILFWLLEKKQLINKIMVNINLIQNKINFVRKYFELIQKLRKFSFKEISQDPFISGNVERYLYLACQSAIDLTETIISVYNFRQPSMARESFRILEEEGFISKDISNSMQSLVGFRNLLSHEYVTLNYDKMYYILQEQSDDIVKFIGEIEKKIN